MRLAENETVTGGGAPGSDEGGLHSSAARPPFWLPVPAFAVGIAVLAVLRIEVVYSSTLLFTALNLVFLTLVSLIISFLAARSFLVKQSTGVLSLGMGALALALGAALAVLRVGGPGTNTVASVYNSAACLAGFCHLAGALVSRSTRGRGRPPGGSPLVLASYAGVALLVLVLVVLVRAQIWPVHFVQGSGPTTFGLAILWAAIGFFGLSAVLFGVRYRSDRSRFHYWYGLGLGLIVVGLVGVSLQRSLGDPLNWAGRSSQYLGGVYMLLAVLPSIRGRAARVLPLERALRESEGRYQKLVDLSPDAIVVTAGGAFVFANEAAVGLFGAGSAEGLLGGRIMDRIHPDDRAAITAGAEELLAGGSTSRLEIRVLRLDGSPVEVEIAGARVEFDGGPAIQVVMRDIAERKTVAEAVKASELRYRRLVEGIAGIVYSLDETGRILFVSDVMHDMLGYTPEEAAGHRVTEYLHPDDAPLAVRAMTELLETDAGSGLELRALTKSGAVRWVQIASRRVANPGQRPTIEGLLTDVTARREAEQGLRESEALFRMMTDTSPLAIYMSVGVEQRAEYINPTFVRLFGYTLDEVPTVDDWWPLAYPDEDYRRSVSEEWQRKAARAIETKTAIEPMEVFVTCKDGSQKVISWGFTSIGDKNWAFGLDLTERKEAEEMIRRANLELQRSNRDLEQFAYVASHDLQEPLRMVASYTQLLARRYEGELDEKAQSYIHYAVDGAMRMQGLINDLLAYSRVGTQGGPLEPTDSHAALGEALRNLTAAIAESHAVVTNDDLPTVRADATQLRQVFQNLISNAVKFRGPDSPHVHVSARRDGADWLFSVRDNGIGIDAKYAERLFVIFQRLHTRQDYPGTGIGLAVCKRIVERHGGTMWFESEPGEGSTFFFTLPR